MMHRMRAQGKGYLGQSLLEYAVLLSVAVLVIVGASVYFKRSLHGKWKESSDQIGEQFTTGQTYTIETRQQSFRREDTGTGGLIKPADGSAKAWSESKVGTSAEFQAPFASILTAIGAKETAYTGAETTRTDYVTATPGGKAHGTHATFDSGVLKDIGLWEDDD